MADENPLLKSVFGAAIHEAGHTVMACLLGIEFEAVTVLWQGSSRGRLIVSEDTVKRLADRDFIMVSLSGYLAETAQFGEYDTLGASSDRRKAVLRIRRIAGQNSIGEGLADYEARTIDIIRNNMDAIVTLADKLCVDSDRTLQDYEVHKLVDVKLIPPPDSFVRREI
jgi:hypothetical protein